MSQPIVVLREDVKARAADVRTLQASGILVLRVNDPSGVSVLSTESVVADGAVFRSMLDMMASVKSDDRYDGREIKARVADALVKYAKAALVLSDTTDSARGA